MSTEKIVTTTLNVITISSCGVIPYHVPTKTFLMVRQRNGDRYWGWPKGHPEKSELLIDAARRELIEEAGITINKEIFMLSDSFYCINYPALMYILKLDQRPQVSIDLSKDSEICDYKWVTIQELIDMTFRMPIRLQTSIFTKHVNCLLLKQFGYPLNDYETQFYAPGSGKGFSTFLNEQQKKLDGQVGAFESSKSKKQSSTNLCETSS